MTEIKEGRVRCIIGKTPDIVEGVVKIDKMWHGGGKIISGKSTWCIAFTTILEYIDEELGH